ncbi:MAG: DUF6779 domain-containing protein [Mycolicibacterium sp.]|uniref:DUF6779 domain-containing protein n=1 Tax=Mycolicibacterium sp. TaxID=2320850 RepID=UPI003D0ACDCE
MTDPTRAARLRRGARRPGWVLLTVLLVFAIGASSALIFTNRAELLRLAVLLALWAAVVAAFVSVIYRRQSDSDQAKVRDLKLVYDLQLDREIAARREYELAVEAQLRRELAAELRAQSADEVSALRAELAALRANLEYLFDTDLSHRHAIETDRAGSQSYGEWAPGADTAGRVRVSRIDAEDVEEVFDDRDHIGDTQEHPIIDVPAEPHPPEPGPVEVEAGGAHRRSAQDAGQFPQRADNRAPSPVPPPPPAASPPSPPPPAAPPPEPLYPWLPPPAPQDRTAESAPEPAGSHWGQAGVERRDDEYVGRRRAPEDPSQAAPPQPPRGRHYSPPASPPTSPPAGPPAEAAASAAVWEHPTASDDPPDAEGGAHTGGQSVAELMARLHATPSGGGRRRRRED